MSSAVLLTGLEVYIDSDQRVRVSHRCSTIASSLNYKCSPIDGERVGTRYRK